MNKKIIWAAAQTAITYLAWSGVTGHATQFNIYKFLAWFCTVIYIFAVLLKSKKSDEEMDKLCAARPIPGWLSFASDLAIAVILAGSGHFFYAALKMVENALEQNFYYKRAQ